MVYCIVVLQQKSKEEYYMELQILLHLFGKLCTVLHVGSVCNFVISKDKIPSQTL